MKLNQDVRAVEGYAARMGLDPVAFAQTAYQLGAAYGGLQPIFGSDETYRYGMGLVGQGRLDQRLVGRLAAQMGNIAQQFGNLPERYGWNPQDFRDYVGQMAQAGYSETDVARELRQYSIPTPFDYSQRLRTLDQQFPGAGFGELVTHDQYGRPINWETGHQLELMQRQQGVARQGLQFQQWGANLQMQGEEMALQHQYADWLRPIQRRDAAFNGDMALGQMNLQIAQAQWNIGQGWGIQQQQRGMQRQLFELGVQWQRQDIQRAGYRSDIQFGWQQQDWAVQRNTFELQQGWGMEDIEEAIRYSHGRDRIRLMRQRERMSTMGNIQRQQMQRDEERGTTMHEWGEEDRQRALEHLKEESDIRRQVMQLDEKAAAAQKKFAQEQLAFMLKERDHMQLKRSELDRQLDFIDQIAVKAQADEEERLQMERDRYAQEKKFYDDMQPLQDKYWKLTDEYEKRMQAYWLAANDHVGEFKSFVLNEMKPGSQLYDYWSQFWAIPANVRYPNRQDLDQALR